MVIILDFDFAIAIVLESMGLKCSISVEFGYRPKIEENEELKMLMARVSRSISYI